MFPIEPIMAAVRPRAICSDIPGALPLEEMVETFIETNQYGAIEIVGGPGSGKTTALHHLSAVFPSAWDILFADDAEIGSIIIQANSRLVVYTSTRKHRDVAATSFQLATWGDDDLIEYLLCEHPDQCCSVMDRLGDTCDGEFVQGIPQLWRIVLDQMAGDASLCGTREALSKYYESRLTRRSVAAHMRTACLAMFIEPTLGAMSGGENSVIRQLENSGCNRRLLKIVRHRPVRLLLAADQMISKLQSSDELEFLAVQLPHDLVCEVARRVRFNDRAINRLEDAFSDCRHRKKDQPMAVSILHATEHPSMPKCLGPLQGTRLDGAYLMEADWPHVNLFAARLHHVDFTSAKMNGAILDESSARRAIFDSAQLRGASLKKIRADYANFANADLTSANFEEADLSAANFSQANLSHANLSRAHLHLADFTDAKLQGARLIAVSLSGAQINGANFTDADLRSATLAKLSLCNGCFRGARFTDANLSRCDLEFLELPDADFERAVLTHATLTGSVMPRANFQAANLTYTGLADIQWEDANLQSADLTGSTFHMGSSRSGMVGSTIASEGSRTGFYTDDYGEQNFKSPEEIRKANLCGADLRGAKVEDVDFYLVDLREARFDEKQGQHFRRCGAILLDRV